MNTDRFKVGRRFASSTQNHAWVILKVDLDNDVVHVVDDFGYGVKIFISTFDDYYFFLDDLPKGFSTDNVDCSHNWKYYYGLKEVYEYCTTCDAKRGKNG